MKTTTDLTKLSHLLVTSTLHMYYETLDDGTKVLRHIRVNQHKLQMPADGGVTVDIVTPDGKIADNKVNSRSVEDESLQVVDLAPEAFTTPQEARDIVAAAIAREAGE